MCVCVFVRVLVCYLHSLCVVFVCMRFSNHEYQPHLWIFYSFWVGIHSFICELESYMVWVSTHWIHHQCKLRHLLNQTINIHLGWLEFISRCMQIQLVHSSIFIVFTQMNCCQCQNSYLCCSGRIKLVLHRFYWRLRSFFSSRWEPDVFLLLMSFSHENRWNRLNKMINLTTRPCVGFMDWKIKLRIKILGLGW